MRVMVNEPFSIFTFSLTGAPNMPAVPVNSRVSGFTVYSPLNDFFSPSHAPEKPVDTASLQILAQISDRSEEEKLLILQTIKDILRLCDLSKKEYEKG